MGNRCLHWGNAWTHALLRVLGPQRLCLSTPKLLSYVCDGPGVALRAGPGQRWEPPGTSYKERLFPGRLGPVSCLSHLGIISPKTGWLQTTEMCSVLPVLEATGLQSRCQQDRALSLGSGEGPSSRLPSSWAPSSPWHSEACR